MATIRVTCALIERDHQVLVAKRPKGKALAGKWEFPGGKINEGETPEVCLIREIKEELGCEVSISRSLSPLIHQYPKFEIELLPFVCEIESGQPEALEHSEIRWLNPQALFDHDLAEADRPIAKDYLNLRRTAYGNAS